MESTLIDARREDDTPSGAGTSFIEIRPVPKQPRHVRHAPDVPRSDLPVPALDSIFVLKVRLDRRPQGRVRVADPRVVSDHPLDLWRIWRGAYDGFRSGRWYVGYFVGDEYGVDVLWLRSVQRQPRGVADVVGDKNGAHV